MEQISRLLLSPYLRGHQSESSSRALLDQKLRSAGLRQYSCRALLAQIEFIESRSNQPPIPVFCAFLSQLSEQNSFPNHPQSTLEWPTKFREQLDIYGWPGERTLTSSEYQTAVRFHTRLNELTQLHLVQEKTSYSSALGQLQSILSQDMYQVSGPDPSIQVLGVLEAAGLQFDYLWVMGLHDLAWPTQAMPNPFIPRALQREHNLPRSSFERELEFCQKLTRGYQQSARQSVFSYPISEGESTLNISPLIRHITPAKPTEVVHSIKPFFQTLFDKLPISLIGIPDIQAPAVPHQAIQRGGSSILKDQSCCPFRAFAIHRLDARPLDWPDPGLQPINRGTLLHQALEIIWGKLQSSEQLHWLSEPEIKLMIEDAITQSLQPFRRQWPELDQLLFLDTEQTRLQQAIRLCLEAEKQRLPFKVFSLEQKQSLQLGDLNIHIKIDRIDELEDGSKVCIDYKTGKAISPKNWFGDRPQDPQLPLYALQQQDNLSALTFLQVFSHETKWLGITESPEQFPELIPLEKVKDADHPDNWNQQLDFWRNSLSAIGQQFIDGHAAVDPFDNKNTCSYCHLKPLCRIAT
jgi:probable DNA repair protein